MRKLITLFSQSLRAILSNKGRSLLTMLGIIIGIGSVIALTSLGAGANEAISGQINKLGTTNLTVTPGSSEIGRPSGGGSQRRGPLSSSVSTLTQADMQALSDATAHPLLKTVAGVVTSSSVVKGELTEERLQVNGVTGSYFDLFTLSPATGGLFSQTDQDSGRRIAVIGEKVRADLFGGTAATSVPKTIMIDGKTIDVITPDTRQAVGSTIVINNKDFQVVGVLKQVEGSQFSDPNTQIYIPMTVAQTLFNAKNISTITAQARSVGEVDAAKADIEKTLLNTHGINDPNLADFSVVSPKDLLSAVGQITGLLTSLLGGIASISLVVGGVGIMNIMLVAVTERTREIGLRKAVGARTSDILIQFLIEALLLTVIGGLLGIALGYGTGTVISRFIDLTPIVTLRSIILAVSVSSAVGLIFGLYPAIKAARLNPIDALRYE